MAQQDKNEMYKQILLQLAKTGYNAYSPEIKQAVYDMVYEGKSPEGGSPEVEAAYGAAAGLANAYMNDGEISDEEAKQIATSTAFEYGTTAADKYYFSDKQGAGYSGAKAGIYAGLGSMASDYAAGRDVDYGKAAESGATAYATTYGKQAAYDAAAKSAANQGASQAGQHAAGSQAAGTFATVASVGIGAWQYGKAKSDASTWYEKRQVSTYNKSQYAGQTLGSFIDLASGGSTGGAGAMAGGVLGGMYAKERYKPKDRNLYMYNDPKNRSVVYDERSGKFIPTEVAGVRRVQTHLGIYMKDYETTPEATATLMREGNAKNLQQANKLNAMLANYDNLSAARQSELDQIMSGEKDLNHQAVMRDTEGNVMFGGSGGTLDTQVGMYQSVGSSDGMGANQEVLSNKYYSQLKKKAEEGGALTQKQQYEMKQYEQLAPKNTAPTTSTATSVTDYDGGLGATPTGVFGQQAIKQEEAYKNFAGHNPNLTQQPTGALQQPIQTQTYISEDGI